jgi:ADP-ribose pyrophosphatase YjhB (NUDIX family)
MPGFCSACGAEIGIPAPAHCASCGRDHWLNASPAACALIVHDGVLLLTRRAIDPWRGLWCAPGGFCNGAEHPIRCAEREALEETGMRIRVIGYLGHWISEYAPAPDAANEAQYCAVSYYHAVPAQPFQTAPQRDEVADLAWFEADDLPAELAPPADAPRIYAAWRDALLGDRTRTPLPDLPD